MAEDLPVRLEGVLEAGSAEEMNGLTVGTGPTLSIVICVYNTAPYLQQCLDSLSAIVGTSIEIIAVDDASTDGSRGILDQHAAREPRLKVVAMPANAGAGPARNAGLVIARGDYIWFVDSDDWIAPDALATIVPALAADPDVLLVGWQRIFPDGHTLPCPAEGLLADAPPSFTLDEWPQAIRILHTPWNKIVKRSFLAQTNYRFSPGRYQDISFTYVLLAAAKRISATPTTLVYYRQHCLAATRSPGVAHLAVLNQWDQTFSSIKQAGHGRATILHPLFKYMNWHLQEVVKNVERLPSSALQDYSDGAKALWRKHRPAGYQGASAGQRIQGVLLRSGRKGATLLRLGAKVSAMARRALGFPHRPLSRLGAFSNPPAAAETKPPLPSLEP